MYRVVSFKSCIWAAWTVCPWTEIYSMLLGSTLSSVQSYDMQYPRLICAVEEVTVADLGLQLEGWQVLARLNTWVNSQQTMTMQCVEWTYLFLQWVGEEREGAQATWALSGLQTNNFAQTQCSLETWYIWKMKCYSSYYLPYYHYPAAGT